MPCTVFLSNNIVIGYHPDLDPANTKNLPEPYLVFDAVPEVLVNIPPGKRVRYNAENESFEYIDMPESPPQPEPLEQKIARLEAELAAAREERLAALEAIAELYETLIGGGTP